MIGFTVELTRHRLGAEVLARIAHERGTADLIWEEASKQRTIYFADGRPELVMDEQGRISGSKEIVVKVVRALALATGGSCTVEPQTRPVDRSLGLDTLGEILVALLRGLTQEQLAAIWQERSGAQVSCTASFERIAAVLPRAGGAALTAPAAGTALDPLVVGEPDAVQRSWVAMIALGGVELRVEATPAPAAAPATPAPAAAQRGPEAAAESPVSTTTPADPVARIPSLPTEPRARQAAVEIAKRWRDMQHLNHYDLLGVPRDASPDAIRQGYFAMARTWHSDRYSDLGLGDEWRHLVEEIFRAAGEAQRVLTDEKERKSYDFLLQRKEQGLPTDVNVILEAEGLFQRARGLVRRGKAAAAEPLLRRAVELNHGEAEFWAYLGAATHAVKGTEGLQEARDAIAKALDRNEKLDEAHEFLGRICHIEGLVQEAQKHFKQALALNPKNVEAARELRLIQMRSSKSREGKGKGGLLSGLFKK